MYYGLNAWLRGRYRESALYRLGLKKPRVVGTMGVWIHALSVGETMAAIPLVHELRRRFSDEPILFSTATESGQKTASAHLLSHVDELFYLPHDFPWGTERILSVLTPRTFIVVETDVWPNLLGSLKARKVPLFLVNGRISPKSLERFRRIRRFSVDLFETFDRCLMQSSIDRTKLVALGVSPEKVVSVGNLKFDMLPEVSDTERNSLAKTLNLEGCLVWVAGSTHAGEEEIILQVFKKLKKRWGELVLVLVPRHPERAKSLKELSTKIGCNTALRTEFDGSGTFEVLVVDTMGELSKLYSLATVTFIGGSLVPMGGHNPLEPLAFHVPVLFGPYMFNFREIEKLLLENNCALKVKGAVGLESAIVTLLEKRDKISAMSESAKKICEENRGVAERVVDMISLFL